MKLFIKILLFFTIFGINIGFAAINLTVSPIKFELEGNPGTIITKTATLYNRGDTDIIIKTGKSDFISSGTDGSPTFVRYSELVHEDQQLSAWIALSSSGFIIPANSKKDITFTIDIPLNATPGGHYGAVFFKNNNSEVSSGIGSTVGINVDYGIIILLNVNGEIVTDININNSNITISGGNSNISNYTNEIFSTNGGYNSSSKKEYNLVGDGSKKSILFKKDNCLLDFTSSNYDGKCFEEPENIIKIATGKEEKNKNKEDKKEEEKEDNFNISFSIPVDNKGNTHVKTTGEIKLFDEDGNQIKQIGKKIIVNEKGAIIGEEIVDYIPVNDNKGNILPGTQRIFKPEWNGFPYKKYSQELGKEIIEYKNPGEYYSDKSSEKEFRLFPWERICYDKQVKKVTAKFDISYINIEGEEISFPSAKEFNIAYTRKYIGYNYYFIFGVIILIILLILFFWIIGLITKKKCINKDCKRRIKRKLKVCHYCETIQKKEKKSKKNKEKTKTILKNKEKSKKSNKKEKK